MVCTQEQKDHLQVKVFSLEVKDQRFFRASICCWIVRSGIEGHVIMSEQTHEFGASRLCSGAPASKLRRANKSSRTRWQMLATS
jgi:hypothetical protein